MAGYEGLRKATGRHGQATHVYTSCGDLRKIPKNVYLLRQGCRWRYMDEAATITCAKAIGSRKTHPRPASMALLPLGLRRECCVQGRPGGTRASSRKQRPS